MTILCIGFTIDCILLYLQSSEAFCNAISVNQNYNQLNYSYDKVEWELGGRGELGEEEKEKEEEGHGCRHQIWIPETENYQKMSSHAQIGPQGAEKKLS